MDEYKIYGLDTYNLMRSDEIWTIVANAVRVTVPYDCSIEWGEGLFVYL